MGAGISWVTNRRNEMKKALLWTIGVWYVAQAILTAWEMKRDKERRAKAVA
jgi:hypothetical protein